VFFKYF
jgi:hypothetical protein